MPDVTGEKYLGIVAGGDAAGGQYIWLTLRLSHGDKTILIEKSKVSSLTLGLMTASGMAHRSRVAANPEENKPGSVDSAYGLVLSDVKTATSFDGASAILDLRIEAGLTQPGNLYVVANRPALLRLRMAVARALLALQNAKRKKANV